MLVRCALVAWAVVGLSAVSASGQATTFPIKRGESFFEQERVWAIHIHLTAQAWKSIQPGARPRFLPRKGSSEPTPMPTRPASRATTKPLAAEPAYEPVISPFGYVYNYAKGKLEVDGEAAAEVAVRFKGNYSYSLSANGPQRPMKIEFGRREAGRRFPGLHTLNLNTSPPDTPLIREPLAYAVFREAGVPAPRTAFARVSLTVDGLCQKQDLGIYTVVEQVDEEFLARHFGRSEGMLLKPEMLRGMPYLGGRWEKYADRYNPKGGQTDQSTRKFIDFLRLVHFADDPTFQQRAAQYLDLDEVLSFIAVQAMIVNFDSFLTTGHNYYLYEHPGDGRYRLLPWDLNLSFGGFGMVAQPAQQMDLSIRRPFVPPNRLIERLLAIAQFRQSYERQLERIATDVFAADKLRRQMAAMERLLRSGDPGAGAHAAATRPMEPPGMHELQSFITPRLESIEAQLAGKRGGFVPGQSPGLLLTGTWQEHRRQSLVQSASITLRQTELSRKPGLSPADMVSQVKGRFELLVAAQKGTCGRQELAEALAEAMPVPDNYVFDPGPGIEWAQIIFRAADANKDDRLTSDELMASVAEAAGRADANGDGQIDRDEVERALTTWAAGN